MPDNNVPLHAKITVVLTKPGAVRPAEDHRFLPGLRHEAVFKPLIRMKLSQFRFDLPLNLIAQNPAKRREDSRMMVVHRHTGEIENKYFRDVQDYFNDKDVFVVNNTKVFPARMYGRKEKTGAKIEVFLLRELNKPNRLWDVIVDPARKIRVGNKLYFGEQEDLVAEVD